MVGIIPAGSDGEIEQMWSNRIVWMSRNKCHAERIFDSQFQFESLNGLQKLPPQSIPLFSRSLRPLLVDLHCPARFLIGPSGNGSQLLPIILDFLHQGNLRACEIIGVQPTHLQMHCARHKI